MTIFSGDVNRNIYQVPQAERQLKSTGRYLELIDKGLDGALSATQIDTATHSSDSHSTTCSVPDSVNNMVKTPASTLSICPTNKKRPNAFAYDTNSSKVDDTMVKTPALTLNICPTKEKRPNVFACDTKSSKVNKENSPKVLSLKRKFATSTPVRKYRLRTADQRHGRYTTATDERHSDEWCESDESDESDETDNESDKEGESEAIQSETTSRPNVGSSSGRVYFIWSDSQREMFNKVFSKWLDKDRGYPTSDEMKLFGELHGVPFERIRTRIVNERMKKRKRTQKNMKMMMCA